MPDLLFVLPLPCVHNFAGASSLMSRKKTPRPAKRTRPAKPSAAQRSDQARRSTGEAGEADRSQRSSRSKRSSRKPTPPTHQLPRLPETAEAFGQFAVNNLYHAHGQAVQSASHHDVYMALSYTVRDFLIDRWRKTTEAQFAANPKFVYYLSAEYLPGKQLAQNMLYTDTEQLARQSLSAHNLNLDRYFDIDVEPGLGNGGLGRLAACFIDSLATLDIPAVGYGIRYEFGIFRQTFEDGWQVEKPDGWLLLGNPWEFVQSDDMVKVGFWGHTEDLRRGKRQHADTLGPESRSVRRAVHDPGAWLPDQDGQHPASLARPGDGGVRFPVVRHW